MSFDIFLIFQKLIDYCLSAPCQHNGTCVTGVNNYSCNCSEGWMGTHCQDAVDYCASGPCQNGGTCTNSVIGYFCRCAKQLAMIIQ